MDREQQLDEVITAFLKSVEAGKPVDRAEWLKRYPDLADALAEFFASQQSVERVAEHVRGVAGSAARAGEPSAPRASADAPTLAPTSHLGKPAGPETVDPMRDRDAPIQTGNKVRYFGHYELLEEIARGGMGIVYRARQVKLNRLVAVKMILAGELAHATDVERFYTEARAAARLHHSNIVAIHEVGHHDGQHYFSMDFIAGESLANRIARGPLPAREAAVLLKKVAAAVAFAHVEGVIHRDLKPANVLLDAKGEPHVTDFGLAKSVGSGQLADGNSGASRHELTATGQILGTPSYMPPEQASGQTKDIGPRADVYSLGAVLYCALTGRPPFQAASTLDTLMQVLDRDPVPPRTLNAAVPRDLETVCLKCLEKEPRRRYETAQELVDELDRYLEGRPILARPIGVADRTVKWMKRRPAAAALIGVSLAALATLVTVGGLYHVELTAALRDANEQRKGVQDRELTLRRHLYGYDIKAAYEARDNENVVRVLSLLKAHVPKPDQEDIRSFDWRYIWKQCQTEQFSIVARASSTALFTADGEHLVTAGQGFKGPGAFIELRDPKTGGLFRTISDCPGALIAIAHDGKTIAAAGQKIVVIYDVSTREQRRVLDVIKDGEGWIRQIEFSPKDPKSLVVVWGDSRAAANPPFVEFALYNLADSSTRTIVKHSGIFGARTTFHPDGKRLAIAAERDVSIWDLTTNQVVVKINDDPRSLVFSPDGKMLAMYRYARDRAIVLVDPASGKELAAFPFTGNTSIEIPLAFAPDSKTLAAAADMAIRLWDVASRKQTGKRLGHTGRITSLGFSPDGKRLVSCAWGRGAGPGAREVGEVKVWDLAEQPIPEKIALDYRQYQSKSSYSSSSYDVTGLSFAPGENRLIVGAVKNSSSARMPPAGLERDLVFERPNYPSRGAAIQFTSVTPAPTTHGLCWQSVNLRRAAHSPDSKFVAVAQARSDKAIAIWDTTSGQTVRTLTKDQPLYAVAFSPDGKTLAGVSLDRAITLWNVADWTERAVLRGHESWIDALIFAADSGTLVTASYDTTVKCWDVATGKVRATLPRHVLRLGFVHVSADGQHVVTGGLCHDSDQSEMKWWDVATAAEKTSLAAYQYGPAAAIFAPDRKSLAVARHDKKGGKAEICLLDLASGQTTATFRGPSTSYSHIAFSPDGASLAAASADKSVTVWQAADAKQPERHEFPEGIQGVVFAPDGKSLAAWDWGQTLRLWRQGAKGEPVVIRDGDGGNWETWTVAFHPSGESVATQRANSHEVKLWDVATGERRGSIKADAGMSPLFAPDGKTLVIDNWIVAQLWDVKTAKELAGAPSGDGQQTIAMSADGKRLLAGRQQHVKAQVATVWDVAAGAEIVALAPSESAIRDAVFSPDNRTLAAIHLDGAVTVWDAATGKSIRRLEPPKLNQFVRVAFSTDAKVLAAAGLDHKVRIVEVATGAELASLPAYANRNLVFAPHGNAIATAGADSAIWLWNWTTGQEITRLQRDLRENDNSSHLFAFSADGLTLATCENRTVRLWDTTTGLERLTLWQSDDDIQHLAFSPDGAMLAAAGRNAVYLWHAASQKEMAAAGR